MKNFLWYIFNLIATLLNYGIRRGMGVLAVPLSAAMGIPQGSTMIFSSIIEWTKSITLIFSTLIDRFPLLSYNIGIVTYTLGIILMSVLTTNYHGMFFGIGVMAIGHSILLISIANFVNRSKGYGRTWDSLTIGIALSCAPLLTGLIFSNSKGIDLINALAGYGIVSFIVFSAISCIILFGKIDYQPKPKAPLNIFKYWNLPGLWRMPFVMIMMSGVIYFVGANFVFLFKSFGVKPLNAIIMFTGIWASVGTCGRVFWSWIGYTYKGGSWYGTIVALSITLIGVMIFPYNLVTVLIGSGLLAFGTAAGQVMVIPTFGERWGHKIFSSTWGLISIIYNLLNGCIILLSGILLNMTGNNYILVYQLYSIMAILAIVLFSTEKNIKYLEPVNGYK